MTTTEERAEERAEEIAAQVMQSYGIPADTNIMIRQAVTDAAQIGLEDGMRPTASPDEVMSGFRDMQECPDFETPRESSAAKLQALLEALPETTPRGFRYVKIPYRDYPSEPERELTVQESSLATENRLWVGPAGGEYRMHLNEDVVRQLRDALTAWLEAAAPELEAEDAPEPDRRHCDERGHKDCEWVNVEGQWTLVHHPAVPGPPIPPPAPPGRPVA